MLISVIYDYRSEKYLDPDLPRYAFSVPHGCPTPIVGDYAVIKNGSALKIVRVVEINPNISDLDVAIEPVVTVFHVT